MLNRIFVVDSVTLTSTGTAVSSYTPWDQTTRKLPTQVVVKATGQGAYVRLSNDASAATNADVLVQGGDHVVLSVQGRRWVSVLSDGASSTVNVGALSTGVSGSAASLDLAFTGAATLDSLVTFTRASTGTFFNSAGVLTSAAINSPRFDYNPSTLAAQGLLIEEARTNLCLQSEDWGSATWSKSGSTITANATAAPTGTTVADKLVEDTSTGTHITTQSISLGGSVDNSAYVISVFAKASERTRFQLFDNAQASSGITSFDLSNGTVVSGTGTITAVGNGWYRCSVFPLKSTSITSTLTIRLISTGTTTSYTGDGTSGIFLFGAQLEAGAFPTSYIPTTTTALTRSADVASVNTLSPWYNATGGTVFVEGSTQFLSGDNAQFFGFTDGTANNFVSISANNVTSVNRIQGNAFVSGVNQFTGVTANNGTYTAGATFKAALAFVTNDAQLAFNGVTVGSNDVSCTVPTVLSMSLGSGYVAGNRPINGYIRRITYYPRRLSNAELQAITV